MNEPTIQVLPNELIAKIFSYLSLKELFSLRIVCHKFNLIACPGFWPIAAERSLDYSDKLVDTLPWRRFLITNCTDDIKQIYTYNENNFFRDIFVQCRQFLMNNMIRALRFKNKLELGQSLDLLGLRTVHDIDKLSPYPQNFSDVCLHLSFLKDNFYLSHAKLMTRQCDFFTNPQKMPLKKVVFDQLEALTADGRQVFKLFKILNFAVHRYVEKTKNQSTPKSDKVDAAYELSRLFITQLTGREELYKKINSLLINTYFLLVANFTFELFLAFFRYNSPWRHYIRGNVLLLALHYLPSTSRYKNCIFPAIEQGEITATMQEGKSTEFALLCVHNKLDLSCLKQCSTSDFLLAIDSILYFGGVYSHQFFGDCRSYINCVVHPPRSHLKFRTKTFLSYLFHHILIFYEPSDFPSITEELLCRMLLIDCDLAPLVVNKWLNKITEPFNFFVLLYQHSWFIYFTHWEKKIIFNHSSVCKLSHGDKKYRHHSLLNEYDLPQSSPLIPKQHFSVLIKYFNQYVRSNVDKVCQCEQLELHCPDKVIHQILLLHYFRHVDFSQITNDERSQYYNAVFSYFRDLAYEKFIYNDKRYKSYCSIVGHNYYNFPSTNSLEKFKALSRMDCFTRPSASSHTFEKVIDKEFLCTVAKSIECSDATLTLELEDICFLFSAPKIFSSFQQNTDWLLAFCHDYPTVFSQLLTLITLTSFGRGKSREMEENHRHFYRDCLKDNMYNTEPAVFLKIVNAIGGKIYPYIKKFSVQQIIDYTNDPAQRDALKCCLEGLKFVTAYQLIGLYIEQGFSVTDADEFIRYCFDQSTKPLCSDGKIYYSQLFKTLRSAVEDKEDELPRGILIKVLELMWEKEIPPLHSASMDYLLDALAGFKPAACSLDRDKNQQLLDAHQWLYRPQQLGESLEDYEQRQDLYCAVLNKSDEKIRQHRKQLKKEQPIATKPTFPWVRAVCISVAIVLLALAIGFGVALATQGLMLLGSLPLSVSIIAMASLGSLVFFFVGHKPKTSTNQTYQPKVEISPFAIQEGQVPPPCERECVETLLRTAYPAAAEEEDNETSLSWLSCFKP